MTMSERSMATLVSRQLLGSPFGAPDGLVPASLDSDKDRQIDGYIDLWYSEPGRKEALGTADFKSSSVRRDLRSV